MAKSALPTIEELRKFLRYEPETGDLYWKMRKPEDFVDGKKGQVGSCNSWNSRFGEKKAFTTIDAYGYYGGRFNWQAMKAHRAAYAIYHGKWPEGDVDHINGIRSDNRIENLRDCTRSQNLSNSRKATGKSRFRGVSQEGKKWVAWCSHQNKSVYGGRYDTEVDAAKAFDALAIKLRGEYAGLNFPR